MPKKLLHFNQQEINIMPKKLLRFNQQQNIVPINSRNIVFRRSPRIYNILIAISSTIETLLVAQEPCNIETRKENKS
jgi:hypothetical protein